MLLLLLIPVAAAVAYATLSPASAAQIADRGLSQAGMPIPPPGVTGGDIVNGRVIAGGRIDTSGRFTGLAPANDIQAGRIVARPRGSTASAIAQAIAQTGVSESVQRANATPATGQSRVGGASRVPSAGALTSAACGIFGSGAATAISVKTSGATDGASGMISAANQRGCEAFVGAHVAAVKGAARGARAAASAIGKGISKINPFD